MEFEALFLSRVQFAFTVTFHIIFPSFTIGLAAWLSVLDGLWLVTGNGIYRRLFDFWIRIFAVAFGMGVVSGIVMAFQFGMNWSVLSDKTGPIQGPLLSYETYTAFLLEATFLGVMLFGRKRVWPWFYFFACCMVALGTTFSAYWIMVNNSWMQVPVGYEVIDGKFVPTDWPAILLSDVVLVRFPHMLLAAYLTTAFCVAATGAWYLLSWRKPEESNVMLTMGLGLAAVLVPLQIFFGHLNGRYVHEHQPAKFAAIEARWHSEQPASEVLFAWPDPENERNLFAISVPYLGSLVASGTLDSREVGLTEFPEEDRPPVRIPFFGFRIMVGIGLLMLAIAWFGIYWQLRDTLADRAWFLWVIFLSFPLGFIAIIAGWFTAEVGRQPWVVYGLLRTADAHTPSLTRSEVLLSLSTYVVVYSLIFLAGTYYIYRLLRNGPDAPAQAAVGGVTAKRPLAVPGASPGSEGRAEDGER